jgi:dienelactone hydrolase
MRAFGRAGIARVLIVVACALGIGLSLATARPQTSQESPTAGKSDTPSPGKITPRLACQAQPDFSYCLYLPSAYAADKVWPIIYCFDPGGHGQIPVERMKDGAEKYGYILAGSNDSRNGPGVPLDSIIAALSQDTRARFPIDDKRVYTAGFSGGARVASAIALAGDRVAGVIACSGGFPTGKVPPRSLPFAFFGTAGKEDFNYAEMYGLAETFDSSGAANRFEVFDGGHAWAPAALCSEAIEWMEIQAMRTGRREKDANLISAFRQTLEARAKEFETTARSYDAYRVFRSLAADLEGLADVKGYQDKAAVLKSSKEAKRAVKEETELIEQQRRRARELSTLMAQMSIKRFSQTSDLPDRPTPTGSGSGGTAGPTTGSTVDASGEQVNPQAELKHLIGLLRKDFVAPQDSPQRVLARRVLNGFFVGLYETAEEMLYSKSYDRAIQTLTIASEVHPDSPGIFVELARGYAGRKEKQKAIDSLKKAVANGLSDPTAIEDQAEFASLSAEPEFKALLAGLKAKH